MAKVFIEETTLSSIGDAIRDKGGTNELISPLDMPNAIINLPSGGGGDIEVEPIVLSGNQDYGCSGAMAGAYLELFGDTVSTEGITSAEYMFKGNTAKRIPFDINFKLDSYQYSNDISLIFDGCINIVELPKLNNVIPQSIANMFNGCFKLKYIPDDYGADWDWSQLQTSTLGTGNVFWHCYNLRKAPKTIIKNNFNLSTSSYGNMYNYLFSYCIVLEEVDGLAVSPATFTSGVFHNMLEKNWRLSHFTFETNEDGTPKTANWKNQKLSFTGSGGFTSQYDSSIDRTLCAYTDITKDKMVIDDATYQALKDDPDWFAANVAYWRYNHDSAVNTINSLPDTSAYLAANGGTNTITFKGEAGSGTDGGAINTMTEEEIAVAAARGWTVSFS